MDIIRRARLFRAIMRCLLAGVALLPATACFDLEVTNPNALDLSRAYVSPTSAEASIVGAWKTGASSMQGRVSGGTCSAVPLAAWANELTGTATLNGGLDPMIYAAEPRTALDNTNVQNCATRFAWYDDYSS